MPSLQGHFLVASPYLADGNFNRTVVLMVKHDDEGAFGLVLNRPTDNRIADFLQLIAEDMPHEIENEEVIYLGGPVSGPVVALHANQEASECEILPGIYFSSLKMHVTQILASEDERYRLFMSYSGWGPGQLEGELEDGGWLIAKATPELVFYPHEDLWQRIIDSIGRTILSPVIPKKNVTDNPALN